MTRDEYLARLTQQHRDKPRFRATVSASIDAALNIATVLDALRGAALHIDTAIGKQLDTLGAWVGAARRIDTDVRGIFFSWDSDDPREAWDYGLWSSSDEQTGQIVLPDAPYRTLIRAKIAANHWDGSIGAYYAAIQEVFAPSDILLVDNQNMTYDLVVSGQPLDSVDQALLLGGYLALKPVGVRIRCYAFPPSQGGPVLIWDRDDDLGRWDVAYWSHEICTSDPPGYTFDLVWDSPILAEGWDYGLWSDGAITPAPILPTPVYYLVWDSAEPREAWDDGVWYVSDVTPGPAPTPDPPTGPRAFGWDINSSTVAGWGDGHWQ